MIKMKLKASIRVAKNIRKMNP